MNRRLLAPLLSFFFCAAGCASTQEIETSPPQARTESSVGDEATAQDAPLTVVLAAGETSLPGDVSRLRLRVSEIQLRRSDGRWVRLPSDSAPVEFGAGERSVRRTLLDTRVAPVEYDSLAITVSDVFVLFGPNAGAPLTTADDAPQHLAFPLEPSRNLRTVVSLRLELGASITRSPDCRWFFVPILLSDVSTTRP